MQVFAIDLEHVYQFYSIGRLKIMKRIYTRQETKDPKRAKIKDESSKVNCVPVLNLSHQNLQWFSEIDIPEGTERVLLTGNRFTDFIGLNIPDSVTTLIVDQNPILSFRGFPKLPNLTSLSLQNTPISGLSNFRQIAIACVGSQLKTLNGTAVSTIERTAGLAYGDSHEMFSQGWLPKRPPTIQKGKSQPKSSRIMNIVQKQDNDPVTVRAVRVLRAQGVEPSQIREFLRNHFSPAKQNITAKPPKKNSAIEEQIKEQQKIIDVMAAQLQALRTGNSTFNQYNAMVESAGALLLQNAEILAHLEHGSPIPEVKEETKLEENYELLRAAVIEYLDADAETPDQELISCLKELAEEEEEEYAVEDEPQE